VENQDSSGRVLLGVTGGIAAYKAAELASLLTKQGRAVRVVMTRAAHNFITPLTFAALTDHPVAGNMFDPEQETAIGHIELARWAQVVVVAPATANFIAKAAAGLADDLLTTLLLATTAPLLVAPAMNPQMYAHPAVQENLETLRRRGVELVGPAQGRTACGEEGAGRMAEPAFIAEEVARLLTPDELAGVKVLVTAGPTREHLDPVRFISNPSTGLMGVEVAAACRRRGAAVTMIMGPTHLEPPFGVQAIRVTSAEEMYRAVMDQYQKADVIIKTAAVSDFRPAERAPHKIKKQGREEESLYLKGTADILAELGRKKGERILVGFAAETQELIANAAKKVREKNLDFLVANDVGSPESGFAVATNRVHFLTPKGQVESLPLMSKRQVAERLCRRLARLVEQRRRGAEG